ncbi:hypothetical protein Gotur_011754 [Gossypium turneri]
MVANFEFNFLIGWLDRFKARHGIKSYRIFGESGSVVKKNIEDALPQIRAKLEILIGRISIIWMKQTYFVVCKQIVHWIQSN